MIFVVALLIAALYGAGLWAIADAGDHYGVRYGWPLVGYTAAVAAVLIALLARR